MSAPMHGQDNRAIHYAMLASVLLHGALLSFSMKEQARRAAPAPAPIVARLVGPEPVAAPRAEEPQPPAVKPAARPTIKPTIKPKPAPKPSPVGKAAPAPPPPTPAAEPQASARAATPAPEASAAPAPSPATAAQASPAPSAGDFDIGALARYRIEVAGLAGKLKRYPRAAIDNNWEGRVVVAVTVRANGVASYSVRV